MCGIAGWIDWQEDLTRQGPLLECMTDTLCNRGPDAGGQWLSPRAALAHRRLIVIDPQTGGQPMVYREGGRTYVITYNGETYNFRELRRELESKGHAFRTRSDTEVLLHAYVEWGEECVRHLNGIFAFGLWDEQKQQLLLARDPLGVKPLYYAQRGSALLFGSELKMLLAHPLVKAEVDAQGLAGILTFIYAPGSGYYRDVQELRPGHLAVCTEQGMRINRHWALRSAPHTDDLPTTAEYIRTLLADTVKRQLIADVPVVTLLSGGLDSSSVTAIAASEFKQEGKELHTYSIDYAGSAQHFSPTALIPSLDAPWVERVSSHCGTHHRTVMIDTSTLIENFLAPLYAYDIPTTGQINTAMYLLFKEIKQQATVALSGESADEVFGGYPWFHNEAMLNAQTFPWVFAPLWSNKSGRSWLSADVLQKVRLPEYIDQQYRQAIAEVPRLEGEDGLAARRREMFYLNQTRWLPFLLDRKDRLSMANGLEVRVPFCDHRLVQYLWNIPWEMKMVDGIEKGILRRAMADVLPDDVRMRRKSAFPTSQHPGYAEMTRAWALQIVNDPNAAIRPLLDVEGARTLLENSNIDQSGSRHRSLAEQIIQLNEWLDRYQVTLSLS